MMGQRVYVCEAILVSKKKLVTLIYSIGYILEYLGLKILKLWELSRYKYNK